MLEHSDGKPTNRNHDKAKKELKQQEQMMQLVSTGHIWIIDAYVDVGYLNIQRHAFLHTGIHRSEIANP